MLSSPPCGPRQAAPSRALTQIKVPMKSNPLDPVSDPADDDWRLDTTARLSEDWKNPWSGQLVPKGSRLTVSSVLQLTKKKRLTIPLPNATALLLNSAAGSFAAARAIRESSAIDKSLHPYVSLRSDKEAFDYIERMIEAIVLAFTAIEAFVNETIPVDFVYARHRGSDAGLDACKTTIERHVPIDEKLTAVLPEVLGCTSPKGSRCWQDYKQLKRTRDRLIHMKSEDRKSSGPETDTLWKAVFVTPPPHLTAKAVIDHFAKAMPRKPGWHACFPHAKI